eukprot:COSAG01_NODE_1596_length_9782_cov_16.488692_4_plen_94_part_00
MDPAAQAPHAVVEMLENLPGMHTVHVLAPLLTTPVPAPTSATDPAPHAAQAICDEALYRPAPHAVHDDAPARLRRSVTEPAAHAMQLVRPALG